MLTPEQPKKISDKEIEKIILGEVEYNDWLNEIHYKDLKKIIKKSDKERKSILKKIDGVCLDDNGELKSKIDDVHFTKNEIIQIRKCVSAEIRQKSYYGEF